MSRKIFFEAWELQKIMGIGGFLCNLCYGNKNRIWYPRTDILDFVRCLTRVSDKFFEKSLIFYAIFYSIASQLSECETRFDPLEFQNNGILTDDPVKKLFQ